MGRAFAGQPLSLFWEFVYWRGHVLTPASGPAVALAQAAKDTEVALLVEVDAVGITPSGNTLVSIIRPSIASFFVSM